MNIFLRITRVQDVQLHYMKSSVGTTGSIIPPSFRDVIARAHILLAHPCTASVFR